MKIAIADAAEFLECGEPRVLELLREGQLPGIKLGKSWVIPREAFFTAVNDLAVAEARDLRGIIASEKARARGEFPAGPRNLAEYRAAVDGAHQQARQLLDAIPVAPQLVMGRPRRPRSA